MGPSNVNIFCQIRCICTSTTRNGKKNFRKFPLYNKRGTKIFKEQQMTNPDSEVPVYHYGVRQTGYTLGKRFVQVPEMIPELMVPDLEGFKLKPYVSYKVPEVVQTEFSAKDLFDAVYSRKIIDDFKNGKLDLDGNPMDPSIEEALEPEDAKVMARKTGSDIF